MPRNALLVYPEFPVSYWGFQYALEFVGKKSSMPPLGLLTVAAMFPKDYCLRVVDTNVELLTDEHLEWADVAFLSAMIIQKRSFQEIAVRCREAGIPVVAGGPYPTSCVDEIENVDHFVLDEVEETFASFLSDFENGTARKVYRSPRRPPVTVSPLPRYDLISLQPYRSMAIQFSRGCPFDCEFCDITKLYGRVPRTKTNAQVIREMQSLYDLGWRGPVFLVDDNFIGNKRDAMRLLPDVAAWQKERGYPFGLYTEASVNLSDIDPLMDAMTDAGFNMVFLGIETPDPKVLKIANKSQNIKQDDENYLLRAVRKIHEKGMNVTAGFIVGMDGDTERSFDAQIEFIQKAGIPTAMVGLLTALKGTNLYHRLVGEGRLLEESDGNNVNIALNFVPQMDRTTLINGYLRVLSTLYDASLKNYFDRCWTQFRQVRPKPVGTATVGRAELIAFAKSLYRQVFSRQGPAYLRFLAKVIARDARRLPDAIALAITGYHFQKLTQQQIRAHSFTTYLAQELREFREFLAQLTSQGESYLDVLQTDVSRRLNRAHARYRRIQLDAQENVREAFESFRRALTLPLAGLRTDDVSSG
jgi:radical SAM superfamily enzyme YgiQ (UPF0313 family)